MHYVLGSVVGLAVGVFCPAIARKLKGYFSKGVAKVETEVKAKV